MEENTLAQWEINTTLFKGEAVSIFAIPFFVFITAFIYIYFIEQSTNILLLVLPVFLFLPIIPAFKEMLNAFKVFKNNLQVYVTETGIYVRYPESGGRYKFLGWESIKQYDVESFGSNSILGNFLPKPDRFHFRVENEQETFAVDAFKGEADYLRKLLQEKEISFGFMK